MLRVTSGYKIYTLGKLLKFPAIYVCHCPWWQYYSHRHTHRQWQCWNLWKRMNVKYHHSTTQGTVGYIIRLSAINHHTTVTTSQQVNTDVNSALGEFRFASGVCHELEIYIQVVIISLSALLFSIHRSVTKNPSLVGSLTLVR